MRCIVLAIVCFVSACVATDYFPYSYTNCGGASDPIQVLSSSINPSPVIFGQNVTVTGSVKVTQTITAQNAGSLTFQVWKHAGFWVSVPCSEIPGGCSYPNFCNVTTVNPTACQTLKRLGLPCGCPIAAGTYSLSNISLGPIPNPPSGLGWLADGSFKLRVQLNDVHNNRLLCAQVVDSAK